MCCSKGPTRVCTLNNHCLCPSAVSKRRLSVVVCHGIHEDAKPGGYLHPVSTHEAAFRAPSPPSSIQTTNMTAHPSSPMVDPRSKPNANQSTVFRATPTAARVPNVLPQAHSSIGLRHPRGRPFVNHATFHSKLAPLPARTCHACEGSKWSRKTHLTTRMTWRSKAWKWEGQK